MKEKIKLGDWVRYTSSDGEWVEGLNVAHSGVTFIIATTSPGWHKHKFARRAVGDHIAPMIDQCQRIIGHTKVAVQPVPPSPQLYDGLTAEQCLEHYTKCQRTDWPGSYLNPCQISAARELWSAQLRARVHASKELDKRQVVIDQDWE